MSFLEAILLAIIEGLTEFLPVSSTGHMILLAAILGIKDDEFTKLFEVCIQFGAICAVLTLYWRRFFQSFDIYFKLFIAFLPVAVLGLLFESFIDDLLGNVAVVAAALMAGGIALIFIDNLFKNAYQDIENLSYRQAFKIGIFQSLAMIPGVSRSAATIVGGQLQGMNRKAAAEFSFLLAIPTMAAATGYKLLKNYHILLDYKSTEGHPELYQLLIIGNLIAFVVALIAIRFFVNILTKYGFRIFGYYRIALGFSILVLLSLGYDLSIR